MLTNRTQLAVAIGTRIYHFLADADSPLNEAKEALFQILKEIGQIEDAVKAGKEALEKKDSPPIAPEPAQPLSEGE